MILYFSGTGNTKFVAEYIAEHIGDECVSLNDILKYKLPLRFNSVKPFVIAAPIYASCYPTIIMKLIRKAEFTGSDKIYFLTTMGAGTGAFEVPLEKIADEKDMAYMGACGVPMPNNYIAGSDLPNADEAESKIKAALPLMKELSEHILAGEMIEKYDRGTSYFVAKLGNVIFEKFFMSSSGYRVSANCVSCGKCEEGCPVNNVKLSPAGVPHFDHYCIGCYACINRCPMNAINIGKKTENRNRYVCPEYSDWKKRGLID